MISHSGASPRGIFMADYAGEPPMMTVADIARRLALSADHVRERLVTRADFPTPAFQIGRTRRWEAAHIERWIIRARSASKSRR